MTPESEVLHSILLKWGAHPRLRISRINTGSGYPPNSRRLVKFGVPGTGDLVGLIAPHGQMIQLETKRLKGKRRESQLTMQRVIRSLGGIYEFVESLEEADRVLIPLIGAPRCLIPDSVR